MPVRPTFQDPIGKLTSSVGVVMDGIGLRQATAQGASEPTSGYRIITNRNSVEVYYIDVTHSRSERGEWQEGFVKRMQPLLVAKFGAGRVDRKDRGGRKGFLIKVS